MNPVTGKSSPGRRYAASTVAHCETVIRTFYEFHLDAGSGPMVNPFPLARHGRAHPHHNPMDPFRSEHAGLYRPRLARRLPRQIPDEMFTKVFAALRSDRDRAMVAFWVSSGARAAELLGSAAGDPDPARQVISVVRKGSRAIQELPACPDAFVYLALYQHRLQGKVTFAADDPLWWTLRPPYRQLTYDAARMMFTRAGAVLGADYSCTICGTLRHTEWPVTRRCCSARVRCGSRTILLAALCRRSCNVQFAPSIRLTRVNVIRAASDVNGANGRRSVHHNGSPGPLGTRPCISCW